MCYYVNFYRDFSNTYRLYYAPAGVPVPKEWKHITRKRAIHLCIRERRARREDPAFSGYADIYIFPAWTANYSCDAREKVNGYVLAEKDIIIYERNCK